MKCTILIPACTQFEANFVLYSLKQIDKYRHPEIEQEIIIADQTESDVFVNLISTLPTRLLKEIRIITMPRIDAGYPIGEGARHATGEYFCSLDADAFPIHRNWLYMPIKLIEKYGLSFVGKQTGLHMHPDYKANGNFFHINNYFRVSYTRTARRCAEEVGFMRYEHREKAGFTPSVNTNWKTHCDNGVIAQWYSDMAKMGTKVSLALTKCVGITNEMGLYGMIIDDLVFHLVFGFSEQWVTDQQKTLGSDWLAWKERMNTEGMDKTLDAMVNAATPKYSHFTDRELFDGEKCVSLSADDKLWQDIEHFKNI